MVVLRTKKFIVKQFQSKFQLPLQRLVKHTVTVSHPLPLPVCETQRIVISSEAA